MPPMPIMHPMPDMPITGMRDMPVMPATPVAQNLAHESEFTPAQPITTSFSPYSQKSPDESLNIVKGPRSGSPDQTSYDQTGVTNQTPHSPKPNHDNPVQPLILPSQQRTPQEISDDSEVETFAALSIRGTPVPSAELYGTSMVALSTQDSEPLEDAYPASYGQYADSEDPNHSSEDSNPVDHPPTNSNDGRIVTTELEYYSEYGSPLPLPQSQFTGRGRFSIASSVGSYADTDSTASLSTGRRSPQSFAASNRESYDQRSFRLSIDSTLSERPGSSESGVPEQRRSSEHPSYLRQRWRTLDDIAEPFPEDHEASSYNDTLQNGPSLSLSFPQDQNFPDNDNSEDNEDNLITPTTQQNALEREIMDSFSDSRHESPERISTPLKPTLSSDTYMSSSPSDPDPEIAALYRDTSHFLSRPLSHVDSDFQPTLPLSSARSRDQSRSLVGVLEGSLENGFESRSQHMQDETIHSAASSSEEEYVTPVTTSTAKGNHYRAFSSSLLLSDDSEPTSAATNPELVGSGRLGEVGMSKVASKLNRPPVFDFLQILNKGDSESRKHAFDDARQKEASYDSGIQNWLRQLQGNLDPSSSSNYGDGLSSGMSINMPPNPKGIRKLSLVRTKSSTLTTALKPSALKMTMPKVASISRVGEKSSNAAKGLFARGRKFMKSDK